MAPDSTSAASPRETARALVCELARDTRLDLETRLRIGRQLRAAERLADEAHDGWTIFGVTSFGQFCEERLNLPAVAGFQLRAAARACECSDDLRQRLENGRLNVEKAGAIAQVLDYVQRVGKEQELLDLAEHGTLRSTRVEVDRLREEARVPEQLIPVALHLTRRAIRDLERTRDLLTDGRGGPRPTRSHAVAAALELFVERKCPERKAARAAARASSAQSAAVSTGGERSNDPRADADDWVATLPNAERSRTILAHDRHAIVSRHGDRCWVEGCEERGALQFAHVRSFRFNGSNRASNLGYWCRYHHGCFDSGRLKLRDGRDGVIIVDRTGQVVGRVRRAPDQDETPPT